MSLTSTLQSLNEIKDQILGIQDDEDDDDVRQVMTNIDEVLGTMYEHVHALVLPASGGYNSNPANHTTKLTMDEF
jgi:hypothetical protein